MSNAATPARDTLNRDNSSPSRFSSETPAMQRALKVAASRGAATLPAEMEPGWMMVPGKKREAQICFSGTRAWRL